MNSTKDIYQAPTALELRAALYDITDKADTAHAMLAGAIATANKILRGEPRPGVYELDDREHATVLAALRYWQENASRGCGCGWDDIATDGGKLKQLDAAEIDALCERINTGG